jgi:hypothetical protein
VVAPSTPACISVGWARPDSSAADQVGQEIVDIVGPPDSITACTVTGDLGRADCSACAGCDLPGQVDGLLRTSFPGKTVSGQDPASFDQLDLVQ